MPIYTRENEKIHFVHIPKTGGKSIRKMFTLSGWTNLYDNHDNQLYVAPGKLYHGHMPYSHWKDWDEAKDCSFEFTIVRNPVTRMNSLIQMWLRSFYLKELTRAYKDGGNFGPGMRKFLIDNDIISPSDSNEVLQMWVANITWPEKKHVQQWMAQANGVSVAQMRSIIDENVAALMRSIANKNIEHKTSKSLKDSTWIDLLEEYMKSGTFENIEREALTPCQMSKYTSDQTFIYKFEDFENVKSDLVERGIFHMGAITAVDNMWKPLNTYKASSWNDSPDTMSRFYELYNEDFEIFGYDKNTPYPGQQSTPALKTSTLS